MPSSPGLPAHGSPIGQGTQAPQKISGAEVTRRFMNARTPHRSPVHFIYTDRQRTSFEPWLWRSANRSWPSPSGTFEPSGSTSRGQISEFLASLLTRALVLGHPVMIVAGWHGLFTACARALRC